MDEIPFEAGPFTRVQQWLGLIRPGNRCLRMRATLIILVAWAPVVILSLVGGVPVRDLFLFNIGVHTRLLLGAPLLILAERLALPRLAAIVRQFGASGIVPREHRPRFDDALRSTTRLLNSPLAEIAILVCAFALGATIRSLIPFDDWRSSHAPVNQALVTAKWWYHAFSVPLFQVLALAWFWRLFVFGRFLWLMSRLPLALVPSHPDLAGGLGFAGAYLPAFAPLAFALSLTVAGGITTLVWREGFSILAFRFVPVLMAVVLLAIVAGPLLVFIPSLRRARFRGIVDYGDLAFQLGRRLEEKWLGAQTSVDVNALSVPDFSATTDLYQVASRVTDMKMLPIDRNDVTRLVAAALLPFVPLVFKAVPITDLLKDAVRLLL